MAYFLGIDDIAYFFFTLQMIAAWFVLVLFSIEIFCMSKNYILAALTPIVLHVFCGNILYGFKTQTFWTAAPVVILGIPLLYFIYMSNLGVRRIWIVILLGLLCSWANVMRNQTAFPIAICATILFLYLFWQERSLIGGLFLIVECLVFYLSYYLICTYIPYVAGLITHSSIIDNEGFVWHSFLCGLGVYQNSYGLEWNDGVINNIIISKYGHMPYSNEYLRACRDLFFQIISENPWFALSTWLKKFFHCIRWSMQILFYPQNVLNKIHPYGEVYYFSSATGCLRNIFIPTAVSFL